MLRHGLDWQTEKVLHLQGGNHHGNTRGKAQSDGLRYILDKAPETHQRHNHQQHPGHQGGQQQATQAIALGNRVENNHKGRGRAGDTEPAAAEQGDHKAGNKGRVQPVLGRNATGNGQSHGQRNGDDADRDAGHRIFQETATGVALVNTGLTDSVDESERKKMSTVGHRWRLLVANETLSLYAHYDYIQC